MNKIIKGIAVIALSIISFSGQSQMIALKGGLNLSNINNSSVFGGLETSVTPGFHLGTTFDIPLNEMFAIETGLFATTKGYQIKESFFGLEIKSTTNILNLEMPVSFKVMFPLGDNVKLYANAGGYIGVALVGVDQLTLEGFGESESDEEKIIFEEDEYGYRDYKRLDYGLTFGFGTEIKGFILGASYDLGLANISADDLTTIQNRVIKITLGYRFGWDN